MFYELYAIKNKPMTSILIASSRSRKEIFSNISKIDIDIFPVFTILEKSRKNCVPIGADTGYVSDGIPLLSSSFVTGFDPTVDPIRRPIIQHKKVGDNYYHEFFDNYV